VQQEGLSPKVMVSFEVTPQGLTKSLKVETSSGYSDVDAAVLEVVRKLKFNPIKDDKVVRGWYYIRIETR
jgi:TonB family protein